jgi:hypothetical protein
MVLQLKVSTLQKIDRWGFWVVNRVSAIVSRISELGSEKEPLKVNLLLFVKIAGQCPYGFAMPSIRNARSMVGSGIDYALVFKDNFCDDPPFFYGNRAFPKDV